MKSIRQLENTYTKICRQNISILFNEICINEEMLPKYTHTHTYIWTRDRNIVFIHPNYSHVSAKECIFLINTWNLVMALKWRGEKISILGFSLLYSGFFSDLRKEIFITICSIHIYIYACVCVCVKIKLAIVVKIDMKAPFSIATTLKYRRGRDSFPWVTQLFPWYVPYSAKC